MMKRDFDSMTAELMLVFLAGFTMVANAINFVAYALAINLEVQEKLHWAIGNLVRVLKGRLPTYQEIQKLCYLDMLLTESLRLFFRYFSRLQSKNNHRVQRWNKS